MSTVLAAPVAKNDTTVLLVASMGCAMTVIDTNIVGVVLPTIARGLDATFADMEWVIGAYVLCFSSLLLPAGSLADRFGRRRVFLFGIALFALASLACGAATTSLILNIARALQGVGSAFLLAPALAIIGHTFREPQARGRAWAIWGGMMGITMVLAPLAGGIISAYFGWRWAFYINIPICLLLAMAVLRTIEESRNPAAGKPDVHGISLFIAAMFSLTWALILAPEHGWGSPEVMGRFIASAWFFLFFALVERYKAQPMLDLRLFRSMPFIGAVLAMFTYAATAQVMTSLLPLMLQNVEGKTALASGVGMLPFALAMLLFPMVARWMAHRMAARWILAAGLGLVGVGNLIIASGVLAQWPWLVITGMAVLGSGGGILNGETQKAIMGTVPHERAGMASGISTTARFSGILQGFALLGAILAGHTRHVLTSTMQASNLPVRDDFITQVVAGDVQRALALWPEKQAQTLSSLIRHSYASGFSLMLVCAALFAFFIALVVVFTVRDRAGSPPNER